jgi:hypothetical protein
MKTRFLPVVPLGLLCLPAFVLAQPSPETAGESPPVIQVPAEPAAPAPAGEQRLYGGAGETVIPADQARAVLEKFKAAYARLGSPRLLFYVNRELVDLDAGLKLTKRTERTEAVRSESKSDLEAAAPAGAPQTQVNVSVGGTASAVTPPAGKGTATGTSEKVTGENTYEARAAAEATLADRQTVRDVERLFGRPFRLAGATLADQKVATSLLPDKPVDSFAAGAGEQARKDREALAKVADVVVEVLVSSRQITVPEVSGDRTVLAPDIQATAIRLSDAAILGQASTRDVLGRDRDAARLVTRFDASDIAEAVALALMEDVTLAAK